MTHRNKCKADLTVENQSMYLQYFNSLWKEKRMFVSIDAEKTFDKIQCPW